VKTYTTKTEIKAFLQSLGSTQADADAIIKTLDLSNGVTETEILVAIAQYAFPSMTNLRRSQAGSKGQSDKARKTAVQSKQELGQVKQQLDDTLQLATDIDVELQTTKQERDTYRQERDTYKSQLLDFQNSEIYNFGKRVWSAIRKSGQERRDELKGDRLVHADDYNNKIDEITVKVQRYVDGADEIGANVEDLRVIVNYIEQHHTSVYRKAMRHLRTIRQQRMAGN
jgi:uncharacterized coiled-coil DUF342 family protein